MVEMAPFAIEYNTKAAPNGHQLVDIYIQSTQNVVPVFVCVHLFQGGLFGGPRMDTISNVPNKCRRYY